MSGDKLSLTDDLADVLAHMVVGWKEQLGVDLAEHPDVVRVMARYRAAKAEYENLVITLEMKQHEVDAVIPPYAEWGRQVESDCNIYGISVWERLQGRIQNLDPASVVFEVREL